MPPKKRTAGTGSRSQRLRLLPAASDLQEAEPAAIVQDPEDIQSTSVPRMVQLNVQVRTTTITAAVSEALKDAITKQHQASVHGNSTTALGQVEHLVDEDISNLTQPYNFLPWVVGKNPASFSVYQHCCKFRC